MEYLKSIYLIFIFYLQAEGVMRQIQEEEWLNLNNITIGIVRNKKRKSKFYLRLPFLS